MKYFTSLLFTLYVIFGMAQRQYPIYQNYDWEIEPSYQSLPEEEKGEKEVILKYNRVKEYEYSQYGLLEYYTIHKIIHVNSDDAIERNNRIYVYVGGNNELVNAKARVIKKNGDVQYFDSDNILESDELDGNGAYKYFPLDGLELGSNVEYLYTVKRSPYLNGTRFSIQDEYITHNLDFTIVSPKNLIYAFKSYNGCPEFILDTLDDDRNHYSVSVNKVEKLTEERYSSHNASLQYFVFKLDENTGTNAKNIITIENMSQSIFKVIHDDLDKKEIKAAVKYLKKMGIAEDLSNLEKVRKIESKIKDDIYINDNIPYNTIKTVLEKKYAGSIGSTKLFVALLMELGIDYEVGFSINRFNKKFDKGFASYYLLDEIFIYLPKYKVYLDPQSMTSRLGFLSGEYTNTDAVHIKPIKVGDFYSGLGKVKFIPAIPYEENIDRMEVDIDLSDFTQTKIDFKRSFTGYSAIDLQPILQLMDEEDRKETEVSYCKFTDDEGELEDYKVLNDSPSDAGENPLIFQGTLVSERYITNADGKYLFKIGMAIGQQSELYSENNRVLPVVNSFNRGYHRTITFEIPEGFKCVNLDKLNVTQQYPKENPTCQFVSSYTIEENKITVEILEFYNQIDYTVEEYPEFQKVINSAADFNKLTLLLEPK